MSHGLGTQPSAPPAGRGRPASSQERGSGPPPATPASSAETPAAPRRPRTRLVLVDVVGGEEPAEGLVLAWAQDDAGAWIAWTVLVQQPSGAVAQQWVPATRLTPVRRS